MKKTNKETIAPFSLVMLIDAIAKEKNIPKAAVIKGLEKAYLSIARKKFSPIVKLEADYMPDLNQIMVMQYKKVVEVVNRVDTEISLQDARELDPEVEVEDELGIDVSSQVEIKRNDVLLVKQIILNTVREATKDQLISDFTSRKGEIVTGIVKRVDQYNILVDLGKAEAVLPIRELIGNEMFKVKDKVQALLLDVYNTNQGAELRLTRTSHKFVVKLMEQEISEIGDGLIEITKIAREPGYRTKVVVKSTDQSTNAVHAVLGNKGYRIQQIMNQMNNEKVNVLPELYDTNEFIRECAKPGTLSKVINTDSMVILVTEDDQLGRLLGAKASNLRLIASLVGKKVGAITETSFKKQMTAIKENFISKNVNELLVEFLIANSVGTKKDLLTNLVKAKTALKVDEADINAAQTVIDSLSEIFLKEDAYGEVKEFALSNKDMKNDSRKKAELQLREELANFGISKR